MKRHIRVGKEGEELSISWLIKNGFTILHRNWKAGRTEIDVVAEKNKELHFIEIKTRTSDKFGYPEQRITRQKLQRIAKAGEEFILQNPQYKEVIIDVLSIKINTKAPNEYYLIEDVRSS